MGYSFFEFLRDIGYVRLDPRVTGWAGRVEGELLSVARQQQAHGARALSRPGLSIYRHGHRSLVHQHQLDVVLAAGTEAAAGRVGYLAHAHLSRPQVLAVDHSQTKLRQRG